MLHAAGGERRFASGRIIHAGGRAGRASGRRRRHGPASPSAPRAAESEWSARAWAPHGLCHLCFPLCHVQFTSMGGSGRMDNAAAPFGVPHSESRYELLNPLRIVPFRSLLSRESLALQPCGPGSPRAICVHARPNGPGSRSARDSCGPVPNAPLSAALWEVDGLTSPASSSRGRPIQPSVRPPTPANLVSPPIPEPPCTTPFLKSVFKPRPPSHAATPAPPT